MKLSRLCEQDKILQELEARIRTLKEDKVCVIIPLADFLASACVKLVCVCLSVMCLDNVLHVPVQDKLESVLDVSHQQMEQYRDQPAHAEKIAYQQRLLQEDVVHIRADISQVSTVRHTLYSHAHYTHYKCSGRVLSHLASLVQLNHKLESPTPPRLPLS